MEHWTGAKLLVFVAIQIEYYRLLLQMSTKVHAKQCGVLYLWPSSERKHLPFLLLLYTEGSSP